MATKQRSVVRVAQQATTTDNKLRTQVIRGLEKDGLSASTMDSFVNFAAKLGIGADNQMSGSSYAFNPITRNRILLEWIYRGSWLAGLAIDILADDMTRAGVDFKTELDPNAQQLIEEEVVTLDIWNKFNEGLKWGRLYGGSLVVLMIDGQDPRTPLRTDLIAPGQFKGLAVFDRWMLEPSLEDLVTEFNQFTGTPRYYRVLSNAPMMQGKSIHYSRVVMRAGGIKLPYQQALIENLWDLSIIERLYDRLVSFDSATTGAAQLVYKSYLRTLKVKGLREIVSAGQNSKALNGLTGYVNMMAKYQGIEGVTLVDGEDEYASEHHGAFSGLSDILTQFGQQLSGALQIPLVRLFGQSPAGLNSTGESDIRTYYDHVRQQQQKTMRVGVATTYKVLAASLAIKLPPEFRLDFKPLWELQYAEKADISERTTNTVISAVESGLISEHTALKELRQSSDVTGVFTNITAEDIEAANKIISPPGLDELAATFGIGGTNAPPAIGSNGTPLAVDPSTQGGSPVQQPTPGGSAPGLTADPGIKPRRVLQLGAPSPTPAQPVRPRSATLGGISGGANASGRF